jgi:DNA-directed RNA polymerase subunit RPC12/RpoP
MERAGQTCSCPACGARAAVPRPANLDGDESTSIEIVDASEVLGKRPAAAAAEWAPEPDAGSSLRHPVAKEPIRFGCRECGAGIKAPVQFAGKKSRCPHCKARVIIPVRSTDTSDEPKPIELLDISEDEERKITANLSRQTRGGSLGGSSAKAGPLIDDPHDRGEGMTGSVLPDALTSASDIPLNQLLSGAPPTSQPAPPPQPASPGRPPPQAPPRPGPPRPSGAGGPTRPGQPGQPAPPARPGPRREG